MAILLVVLAATTGWFGYVAMATPAPTINSICEPGGCGSGFPFTFGFYQDGSTYLAVKGIGGGNAYTGTSLSTVFASVMGDTLCGSGCSLYFGDGIWTVDVSLTITHSFVKMQGADWSRTEFTAKNSLNGDVINAGTCNPCYYLTFRDFSIDGNGVNQASGNGINLQRMNRPNIDHVRVHNAKGDGFSGSCGTFTCNSPYIENSLADSNGNRGLLLQSVFGAYVIHTAFDANVGSAITLASGGESFFTTLELDGSNPWGIIIDTESRDNFNGIWCGTTQNYCIRTDNTLNDPYFNNILSSAGTPGGVQFDASTVCNRCVIHDLTNTGGAGTTGFNFIAGSKFFNSTISDSDISQAPTKISGTVPLNVTFDNVRGLNPVGKITNPIDNTAHYIRYSGSSAGPTVASQDYIVANMPMYFTSTGGTSVSITIKDTAGNTVYAPGATLTVPFLVLVGWKVNWGACSPCNQVVTVWGD